MQHVVNCGGFHCVFQGFPVTVGFLPGQVRGLFALLAVLPLLPFLVDVGTLLVGYPAEPGQSGVLTHFVKQAYFLAAADELAGLDFPDAYRVFLRCSHQPCHQNQ